MDFPRTRFENRDYVLQKVRIPGFLLVVVGNFGVDRLLFRQIFVLLLKICPMKRILLWAVVLLGLPTVSRSLAQSNFREQIEARNREIIAEGDLLYRCERAAWLATDIALAHEELKNNFWGYIVSPEEDTVRVVILDRFVALYLLAFVLGVSGGRLHSESGGAGPFTSRADPLRRADENSRRDCPPEIRPYGCAGGFFAEFLAGSLREGL